MGHSDKLPFAEVDCPLDVCPKTTNSRLKIVDVDRSKPELPSWSPNHHCKTSPASKKVRRRGRDVPCRWCFFGRSRKAVNVVIFP